MRKPHQLILPEAHTSKYSNSFFYRSSLVWNTLPAAIQNITCLRKKLKKLVSTHALHPIQSNLENLQNLPEASTFFLSIIQFPPSAFSCSPSIFFSFLLHSSLIFLHSWHNHYSFIYHTWNRFFYIVHCNFVYFSPLGDPLDQGLVPVGESNLSVDV